MKAILRKSLIALFTTVLISGLFAFTPTGERLFLISKNLDIFATLFKEVNTYYVDEVNPNDMVKKGIDAMLQSLDPYTNYIPEDDIEDYRTQTTGQYGGIGAIIGKRNNATTILMPYENFPAAKAGLKIGDEILEVDGIKVTDKATNDVSKLLKGQSDTKVKLVIKRFGNPKNLEFELMREKIKIENVPYHGLITEEIGYLILSDFTPNASSEVKNALLNLKAQGAKKIIFDLRGNPGGLLSEAVNVSNLFISKDLEVVSTKGKVTEWNKTYTALNPPVDTQIPLVVLTSSTSASASEIVAGVIQDYDRGVLAGQRSFGKGLVQATRPLSYNSQVKITTAKYYIPSGRCIQAIDYAHRNEDGSVGSIPDSLKRAFKTKNGRVVYDGGGVTPDITVTQTTIAPITQSLLIKGHIFDFATKYAAENTSIPPAKEFQVDDKVYNEFTTWLKDKDYDYVTKVENTLKQMEEAAQKEKYYDDIKDAMEALKQKVNHNKEQDLLTFRQEITELLEEEIAKRYYLQKGSIEASFDNDPEIQAAIKVLSDMDEYKKILSAPKK